jgi:hypothetical protein
MKPVFKLKFVHGHIAKNFLVTIDLSGENLPVCDLSDFSGYLQVYSDMFELYAGSA